MWYEFVILENTSFAPLYDGWYPTLDSCQDGISMLVSYMIASIKSQYSIFELQQYNNDCFNEALPLSIIKSYTMQQILKQLSSKIIRMLRRLLFDGKRSFCFFEKQISEKYGQQCCRYGQNGKPMQTEKASQTLQSLNQFLNGWKLQQNGTRLKKHFYVENYPSALKFIEEVVALDCHEFKQCPSYHVKKGQILELQLYSLTLNGLSLVDFQLAMRINNLNHKMFSLLELKDEKNYRKEISKVRMDRQSARIQAQLAEDEKNWKKKV